MQVLYCLKIAEPWAAESLRDGTAWFSTIGFYIEKAEKDHNDEQGDAYEGVFARQKKNSRYVEKCRKLFGDDLEIIKDGEHCLLRRKSSRNVCAFCVYVLKPENLTPICEPYYENGLLMCKFEHHISKEMFDKFLDKGLEVASVSASVGDLNSAIDKAVQKVGGKVHRQDLVYDLDITKEFRIKGVKPGSPYIELFHKQKRFSYQHEMRTLISNVKRNPNEVGIPIHYEKLDEGSMVYDKDTKGGFRLVLECSIKKED